MAWRTLFLDDTTWHVHPAAELRPHTRAWQLVLSFRNAGDNGNGRKAFWVPYPLEAMSKSSLFAQAETISDDKLQAVLVEHTA